MSITTEHVIPNQRIQALIVRSRSTPRKACKGVAGHERVPLRKGDEAQNDAYQGLYVDGGMLNNYPIHAFDHIARMPGLTFQNRTNSVGGFTVAMPSSEEHPFNRSCVGFRLGLRNNAKYEAADDFGEDQLGVLGSYLGSLLLTILSDASDSHMKSAEEWTRTCILDPTGLGLVDFAGPRIDIARRRPDRALLKREAIEKAFQSTMAFWK